jgi:hypothetical protein
MLAIPKKMIGGQRTICPLIYDRLQYMPYALYLKGMICGNIPSNQGSQELGRCLSRYVNLIQNFIEATGLTFRQAHLFAQRHNTCSEQSHQIPLRLR